MYLVSDWERNNNNFIPHESNAEKIIGIGICSPPRRQAAIAHRVHQFCVLARKRELWKRSEEREREREREGGKERANRFCVALFCTIVVHQAFLFLLLTAVSAFPTREGEGEEGDDGRRWSHNNLSPLLSLSLSLSLFPLPDFSEGRSLGGDTLFYSLSLASGLPCSLPPFTTAFLPSFSSYFSYFQGTWEKISSPEEGTDGEANQEGFRFLQFLENVIFCHPSRG